MRKFRFVLFTLTAFMAQLALAGEAAAPINWAVNATAIEACSCPMFCQCYFDTKPAKHHDHATGAEKHFCKFNMAYKVNKGHYGDTKLDGAKFWLTGDLGASFGDGEVDYVIVTFDPAVTKEQREGIATALGKLFPVKFTSFSVAKDAPIEWMAGKDGAMAKLDGGKAAEIVLTRFRGMTDEPVVIKNLRYFGAPRNDGFIMMPNEIEAYRLGDKAFEFRGTNGFMITVDLKSSDFAASPSGK